MYTVLLIEDCANTGSLLRDYLSKPHLDRLTDRTFAGGVWHDATGTPYESSHDELSAGQLLHLRHGLDTYVEENADLPEIVWFPRNEIDALTEACRIEHPDERARSLETLITVHGGLDQMIMIADLALTRDEARRMEDAGARDEVHGTSRRRRFRDPRATLRSLTGFRLMQTFSRHMPVIVTTYSTSPIVLQHCLVSGAFAIVRKPVEQRSTTHAFDMHTARGRAIHALEVSARCNADSLDVVVAHYAMTMASEVLKAVSARVISNARP